MKTISILFLALFFLAIAQSAEAADEYFQVGGDFGKSWLSNEMVQNPRSIGQDDELDVYNISKEDKTSAGENVSNQDWLNATAILGA